MFQQEIIKDVSARLKEHQLPTPSKWRERAEWRMQSKSWLRHSQRIAVRMLEKMDELSMTQKQLANMMGGQSAIRFKGSERSREPFSRNHVEDSELSETINSLGGSLLLEFYCFLI